MADSVREKILQNIVTTLQGITQAAGYANTVALVERLEQDGESQAGIPAIYVKEDECDEKWGAAPCVDHTLRLLLVILTQHNKSVDARSTSQVINSILADVKKAIFTDVTRGSVARNTNPSGTSPIFVEENGEGCGVVLAIEVQYSHPYDDPYTAM